MRHGVRLIGLLCRAVFPDEFNSLVDQSNNKADGAVADHTGARDQSLRIDSDGLGASNVRQAWRCDYYHPLLQTQFVDDRIEVRTERGEASEYRFGSDERRVEIGFYVGGERFLPVALASMTAKYFREIAMRPFNEFWCESAGIEADGRISGRFAAIQKTNCPRAARTSHRRPDCVALPIKLV